MEGLIKDPSSMLPLEENKEFYGVLINAIRCFRIETIRERMRECEDVFECLDLLIRDLESGGVPETYHSHFRVLHNIVSLYSCIGQFSPKVSILLKSGLTFVIDGLPADVVELGEKDIKRISIVYASIILNITTNPKIWAGSTHPVGLVGWSKDLEKRGIDKETFNAFRSYLSNKF